MDLDAFCRKRVSQHSQLVAILISHSSTGAIIGTSRSTSLAAADIAIAHVLSSAQKQLRGINSQHRGALRSTTAFLDAGSVLHHCNKTPLIVTLMASSTATISLPTARVDIGFMRSLAAEIHAYVVARVLKIYSKPVAGVSTVHDSNDVAVGRSSSGCSAIDSITTSAAGNRFAIKSSSVVKGNLNEDSGASWEERLVDRVAVHGWPVPWSLRAKAWPLLARGMDRRAAIRRKKMPLNSIAVPLNIVAGDLCGQKGDALGFETHPRNKESIKQIALSISSHAPSRAVQDRIWRDVERTYVSEPFFRGGRASAGVKMLYEVLASFAAADRGVGYCQGLNFVAALFLLVTQAEERGNSAAFDMFIVVVREVRGCFTRGLPGFRRALDILSLLVEQHLPRLAKHLFSPEEGVGHGLHLQMFASPWLQCLFCHPSVPRPFAMHAMDLFLCIGFEAVIRISLALLAQCEAEALNLDNRVDLITLLQHAPSRLRPAEFESTILRALSFELGRDVRYDLASIGSVTLDDLIDAQSSHSNRSTGSDGDASSRSRAWSSACSDYDGSDVDVSTHSTGGSMTLNLGEGDIVEREHNETNEEEGILGAPFLDPDHLFDGLTFDEAGICLDDEDIMAPTMASAKAVAPDKIKESAL